MAAHSSTLAWKISWTEESSGLQSMSLKESGTTERLTLIYLLRDPLQLPNIFCESAKLSR